MAHTIGTCDTGIFMLVDCRSLMLHDVCPYKNMVKNLQCAMLYLEIFEMGGKTSI